MAADHERRRVLLAASASERLALRTLFVHESLHTWDVLEANSFEQAHFVLQHDLCDLVLVDESLCRDEDWPSLSWLTGQRRISVVLLAEPDAERIAEALERGVAQWLPRDFVRSHPVLLSAVLRREVQRDALRQDSCQEGDALHDCRRQVHRLVNLLWEVAPVDSRTRWFTQRHMLERLQEELARSKRYGEPLAVVLGEVEAAVQEPVPEGNSLEVWSAEQVLRFKRRSDVAGHYGPNGFMLLMAHTNEKGATICCRRLQSVLKHPPATPQGPHAAVFSHFGIASFSAAMSTPQSLLSCAEQRLDEAKSTRAGQHL